MYRPSESSSIPTFCYPPSQNTRPLSMSTQAGSVLFLLAILITTCFASSQNSQKILLPASEDTISHIPGSLSECSFDGEFGVTWFPRCQFGGLTGGSVTGWPKKGGYYTHLCSIVELEFLGLDRFKPANSSGDPDEEEAHCARMRQLGATWVKDLDSEIENQWKYDSPDSPRLYAGWPADGGVWVLYTTFSQTKRKGLGRIGNALTMEERWKLIKELGGTFYAKPKDCPYLDLDGLEDKGNK
ncbi:unnamed protein product [Fusarium fujikuroi]|uniref:Uncharacterized protein n=1 Tax=Fusarium fujikuroi TaxID=5127 RepID=A0A9Q9RJ65_FUSFU|nr:unnamed protein product [Fusarium fujikuroi]VTT78325.1 unnamed protein product [Fusarium fujikuroi]VZH88936.1 unnamed protein product [Fusarium fujikuroi]